MTNLIYLLGLCGEKEVKDILYLVGIVVMALKIAVPIVLIIVGAVKLFSAMSEQKDDEIQKATKSLGKKAVAAVAIFLLPSIVGLLMKLIGGTAYKECWTVIESPGKYKPQWSDVDSGD